MANILDELAAHARERVEQAKERVSSIKMQELARRRVDIERRAIMEGHRDAINGCVTMDEEGEFIFPLEAALRNGDVTFICECKKASPSKGVIAEAFPYLEIAKEYEAAGAGAISVLTEPKWFLGSEEYLKEIAAEVKIPVLRKDFTVDEYMIYEAKVLGASAVLLICAILDEETIRRYLEICDSLGLSALVEAHDEEEIATAIRAGARIIGVNNRNLKDFTVDVHNSEKLRQLAPPEILFIAESGIKTAEDIQVLRDAGVNGVLVGETLMRASNKKEMLRELRGVAQPQIKICGMMSLEDIQYVNQFRPEYCGFIISQGFRRTVPRDLVRQMKAALSKDIKAVGVYVNEPLDNIVADVEEGLIDLVQLHGAETEEDIKALRAKVSVQIIKAFKIKSSEDLVRAVGCSADYLLLDNGTGTGQTFDWSLIDRLEDGDRARTFLAGGLNKGNVREAMEKIRPFALDTSSGVETEGAKDKEKIREYISLIRRG